VAALVLMYFGTGTVKGFAIILSIGLVINMFTALTFTRYLLGLASNVTKNTRLYGV
jgi:preprotein translocase subunit SecD